MSGPYRDLDDIERFLDRGPERRGWGGVDGLPMTTSFARNRVLFRARQLREGIWARVRIPAVNRPPTQEEIFRPVKDGWMGRTDDGTRYRTVLQDAFTHGLGYHPITCTYYQAHKVRLVRDELADAI